MDSIFEGAPRIAMGCWAIGGPFWSGDVSVGYAGTNDADSAGAIHAAWDAGVRVFDTSAVYGAGHSETLLGKTLGNRPDAIIVSKFGHAFDAETKQMTGPKFDPAYVRDSIDQSRKRLQRDKIDVMLLHLNGLSVDEATPAFDTLEELVAAGHIGAFGWSTDFPGSVDAMAGRDGFIAVQHAMNLFIDASSMYATARAHEVVQLIRSPLGMGVLTGKYSDGYRVASGDIRANDAQWQGYFTDGTASPDRARQLDAVRDLITVGGRTLAQGALCWLLAKSPRTVPLPGAKNAEQAKENAGAMDHGPLPDAIIDEIEAVLNRPPEGPPKER